MLKKVSVNFFLLKAIYGKEKIEKKKQREKKEKWYKIPWDFICGHTTFFYPQSTPKFLQVFFNQITYTKTEENFFKKN